MEKTAKQIVTEYRIKCALAITVYIAALALLIWLMETSIFVSIAGIVVLGASVRATYDNLLEKNIESVIHDKLDPKTYNEILALGIAKKNIHMQTQWRRCIPKVWNQCLRNSLSLGETTGC